MSEILKKEKSLVTLKMTVKGEDFAKAIDTVFKKNRTRFSIPGFRKGKAPRKIVESYYGQGVFYEDALNEVFPTIFTEAIKEHELDVVSRPEIEELGEVQSGEDFDVTVQVYVRPEVTLGEYKGLEVAKEEVEVTDEEINQDLEIKREQNARMVAIEDRPAKDGDTVVIDFEGKVDGVTFDGGKGEGYTLVLGSNSFIDGFEAQVVGMNLEEVKDINVTFPEQYHSEDLQGKDAVFTVKLHEIKEKELPELDDDFVMDISEFETLEELKADIRAKLYETKKAGAETAYRNAIIDKAVEASTVEVPDVMIENEVESMAHEFGQNLQYQGLQLEDYFKYTKSNMMDLKGQMRPDAERKVRNSLVLDEISKVENIEVSDEDLEKEYTKMAEQYKMEVEKVKELVGRTDVEVLKDNIRIQKTIDLLIASAK